MKKLRLSRVNFLHIKGHRLYQLATDFAIDVDTMALLSIAEDPRWISDDMRRLFPGLHVHRLLLSYLTVKHTDLWCVKSFGKLQLVDCLVSCVHLVQICMQASTVTLSGINEIAQFDDIGRIDTVEYQNIVKFLQIHGRIDENFNIGRLQIQQVALMPSWHTHVNQSTFFIDVHDKRVLLINQPLSRPIPYNCRCPPSRKWMKEMTEKFYTVLCCTLLLLMCFAVINFFRLFLKN